MFIKISTDSQSNNLHCASTRKWAVAQEQDSSRRKARRAKAIWLRCALDNDPRKIHQWVHDNIQFIPSYGAIQGSQMTLENRRGNAFDTASLLIALLRAAGIHSRYVYGTVQIPIEQAMNWVGGVTSPEAATDLLSQGGIPTTAITQGGKIIAVKLEHIWAEAWVDYYPGRGAIHRTGDSWVPMDASFKQYAFTNGMDLPNAVPFDAEGLLNQIQNSAQINETEGWVSGIDNNNLIKTAINDYQTQIEQHVQQTKADATVGDVLGSQTINIDNRPQLSLGLPYQLRAKTSAFAALPDSFKKRFEYHLYATDSARTLGNSLFSFTQSLPQLAGKRLTLSFRPASDADQQLIESFLPDVPADGNIDPGSLPTSLPGYLINLIAEFKVDGEVKASSSPLKMGTELQSVTRISRMTGGMIEAVNKPIAGEFYAIGLDLQGISADQLETVKDRMENTKTQLENQQFVGLEKDDVVGDLLHAAAISYFAANDVNLSLLNRVGQTIGYRQPSFGTFSTNLTPIYNFGIPREVEMSGIFVDMDAVTQSLKAKNADNQTTVATAQQIGLLVSALEHRIPELFFSDENNPAEGISAVKALAVAAAEGQRIYQITADNINTVLPQLTVSDDIKSEIQSAVTLGQEATVSQGNITLAGWTGAGYIITDPNTGAGAYKISGGGNGTVLQMLRDNLGYLNIFNGLIMFVIAGFSLAGTVIGLYIMSVLAISYISLGLAQLTGLDGLFLWGVATGFSLMALVVTSVMVGPTLPVSIFFFAIGMLLGLVSVLFPKVLGVSRFYEILRRRFLAIYRYSLYS